MLDIPKLLRNVERLEKFLHDLFDYLMFAGLKYEVKEKIKYKFLNKTVNSTYLKNLILQEVVGQ